MCVRGWRALKVGEGLDGCGGGQTGSEGPLKCGFFCVLRAPPWPRLKKLWSAARRLAVFSLLCRDWQLLKLLIRHHNSLLGPRTQPGGPQYGNSCTTHTGQAGRWHGP
jgi:hypothetical protein